MKTVTCSDLRKTLAHTLDRVASDHEPAIVMKRGKPIAVLISLEDYASWEETHYLLRSPANAKRLRGAVAELEAGQGKARKLADAGPFATFTEWASDADDEAYRSL